MGGESRTREPLPNQGDLIPSFSQGRERLGASSPEAGTRTAPTDCTIRLFPSDCTHHQTAPIIRLHPTSDCTIRLHPPSDCTHHQTAPTIRLHPSDCTIRLYPPSDCTHQTSPIRLHPSDCTHHQTAPTIRLHHQTAPIRLHPPSGCTHQTAPTDCTT